MNSLEIVRTARENLFIKDKSFFENGWLWRQLAIHGLIDYRNEYSFVRKMQCEIFEFGLLPFSKEEYEICKNISHFLHGESDHISSDDFQHILCRFQSNPKKVEELKRQFKFLAWKTKFIL